MTSRRSFLTGAAWLAASAGAVWLVGERVLWPQPQVAATSGGSSGWLAFAARNASIPTIKVSIGGREVNALVDSGAQYSAIDRALVEALDLPTGFTPTVAVGVSGEPQVGQATTLDVTVGEMGLSGLKAIVLGLGPIAAAQGLSAPLILGQDVLQQVIADIDFPRRRLRLADPAAFERPAGATAAPVRRKGRALAARIEVDGAPLEVIVDTGASVVLALARDVAEAAGLLAGQTPRTGSSIVLGGQVSGQIVTARRVVFGDAVYRNADVMIYRPQRLPGFPRGLLGAGALGRFRAVLDHAGGSMHLVGG